MEFKIEKPKADIAYPRKDVDLAFKFTQDMYKEFGNILKAIVLFGSQAKQERLKGDDLSDAGKPSSEGDIDLLVIVDDVSVSLSSELVETYRIIVKKLIVDTSERLHITSLKLSSFWGYVRVGDPVGLNILRDGIALLDSGFFDPLKALLSRGMIRPSAEAVGTYLARAPKTLENSRWHLLQATVDLYWAVIDATHAVLMTQDTVPPSPEHAASMFEDTIVKKKLLDAKHAATINKFFKLYKSITRKEVKEVSGAEFEAYYKEARGFVEAMQRFIRK
jgi:uncharacterized protein (UPF0332 family)/predicted nucleotidyltransferase